MRSWLMTSAGVIALVLAAPASAQQADAGVNTYLCTFAGKCDAGQSADAAPTKAAPATKGFRLAAPQQAQPTMTAPAVKGFRIALPQQLQPTTAAPATKSFRIARSTTVAAAPSMRTARAVPHVLHRTDAQATAYANRTQVQPVVTMGGTRANLMLNFHNNSDRMTDAAQGKARTFALALMMPELKDKRFLIEGHTDSKGSRDLNVDLSRRRAQSVADFLVTQGVDRDRVEVKGVGPDEPLPGHSAAAEANRRVEAVLL